MEIKNDDSKSKMEDYAAIEQIGRGAFRAAFLVLHKAENKKYVLKKIRLSKQTEKFKSKVFQEMSLIAKLRHPYILEYKDAWVEKGNCICILTNYCEVGNISELVRKARGAYFSEERICKWLTQLLLAIDYLHSNRVLHRDLKLSNIFVTKENDICLGDFGLAKLLNEEGLASSVVGTPNYLCPELLENMPYGYKSDIWSLGCCMFEIAAHQHAFKAPNMTGLVNKINRSLISPMPIVYSSTLKQIIKSMLRKNPEHRPTAAELLRNPHLQPFLLRCHNLSTVFLPVKSPSPNSTKEKTKITSSSISDSGEDHREREAEQNPRELLPLFEESTNVQYPNLLDGDALIEDLLETKRVDPTSYSGKVSHDGEDSKCGDTSETTACNGDDDDNSYSSTLQESNNTMDALKRLSNALCEGQDCSLKNTTGSSETDRESVKITDEPLCSPELTEEINTNVEDTFIEKLSKLSMADTIFSNNTVSRFDENMPLIKDNVISEVDAELRSSFSVEVNTSERSGVLPNVMRIEDAETCPDEKVVKIKEDDPTEPRQPEKGTSDDPLLNTQATVGTDGSNGKWENPGQHRAHALESLLELCARLLNQDKFDELSGVLKAFGEDAVSSRETAIWLTKSLMNAQKLAKDS